MAISLYDATVASFLQTLGAVEGFLAKGLDHCRTKNIDPESIVATRIYDDMFPFRFQVLQTVAHSIGAIEAVRKGVFSPPPQAELDYAGLQKAVADAREALKKLAATEVNGFTGRDMKFEFRDRSIPFTAENFLLSFSLPN
ncbi:MAG TPA: DUF1993 family protein, partial [Steroidobacteraceae bacterium]|nr:DUF1993 family protein [Steroidobacteraceae bacterium]